MQEVIRGQLHRTTKNKIENRKLNIQKKFRVTEAENKIIHARVKEVNAKTESDYLRKVAIDTCYVSVNLQPIITLSREINHIGNNINQIAKQCNTDNAVTAENIGIILALMDKIDKTMEKEMKLFNGLKEKGNKEFWTDT